MIAFSIHPTAAAVFPVLISLLEFSRTLRNLVRVVRWDRDAASVNDGTWLQHGVAPTYCAKRNEDVLILRRHARASAHTRQVHTTGRCSHGTAACIPHEPMTARAHAAKVAATRVAERSTAPGATAGVVVRVADRAHGAVTRSQPPVTH